MAKTDNRNILHPGGSALSSARKAKAQDPAGKKVLRPLISLYKSREEVRQEIDSSPSMSATFNEWSLDKQEEFLDLCSGNRGVRILYDSFFKYVFDPVSGDQALKQLISVLLGRTIRSIRILPNESRLTGDYTLVIMDIVVEIDDGTIVNVEVQKVGFLFPGERAACYSADLLLRQYQRVRHEGTGKEETGQKAGKFSYRFIHPVYTIVFLEKSTAEFNTGDCADHYIHAFNQKSDTGLQLNLLQNYIFVPLDVFRKKLEDKEKLTEQEAWLAFLSTDDPQIICRIISQYPETFRSLYEKIADLCRNTEEVMNMFSKELQILDQNTIMTMVEEQQEEIEKQKEEMERQQEEMERQQEEIERQKKELEGRDKELDRKDKEIASLRALLAELKADS